MKDKIKDFLSNEKNREDLKLLIVIIVITVAFTIIWATNRVHKEDPKPTTSFTDTYISPCDVIYERELLEDDDVSMFLGSATIIKIGKHHILSMEKLGSNKVSDVVFMTDRPGVYVDEDGFLRIAAPEGEFTLNDHDDYLVCCELDEETRIVITTTDDVSYTGFCVTHDSAQGVEGRIKLFIPTSDSDVSSGYRITD